MAHAILLVALTLFGALISYNASIISIFNEHSDLRCIPLAVLVVLAVTTLLHIVYGWRYWMLLVLPAIFVGASVILQTLPSSFRDPRIAVAASIVDIWILPHLLLRWQLRCRRFAALDTAAIQRALSKWITNPPSPNEMTVATQKNVHPSRKFHPCKDRCFILLDYIFPFPHSSPPPPEGGLPKCLSKNIRHHYRNPQSNTHALIGEWLVTAGSIVILLTTILFFYSISHKANKHSSVSLIFTHERSQIRESSTLFRHGINMLPSMKRHRRYL